MSERSLFVVVEGADRVGKNTQADLLAERLRSRGVRTHNFTTPDYATETGRLISKFLLDDVGVVGKLGAGHYADDAVALQALMLANRLRVASRILEILALGESAVCVRWWPSALLYGEADGLDPSEIRAACSFLPEPDLYVLLDADLDRVADRLDRGSWYEKDMVVQQRLIVAYRRLWLKRGESEPLRWVVVRDDVAPDAVAERVWRSVCSARPDLEKIAGGRSSP